MAEKPRMIGLLLLPAFSHLAMSAIIEPLFIANWLSGRTLYRWRTLSRDGKPAVASSEIKVPVDAAMDGGIDYDSLFVLASFDLKDLAKDRALKAWLRKVARHGATIG